MRMFIKAGMLAIGTLHMATGCGGGGGTSAATVAVSGVASKNLISGGTVKIYSVDAAGTVGSTPIGQGTTGTDGSYNITITQTSGPIVVVVTGGTYQDEATGQTKNLVDQAPAGLRAALPNASSSVSTAVTPLTEIAVQRAQATQLNATSINAANQVVSTIFGINSVTTTLPLSSASIPATGATTDAEKYALALVAISRMCNSSGKIVATLLTQDFVQQIDGAGNLSAATQTSFNNAKTIPVTTLSASKASALATGSDTISLTASFSPTVLSGSVTFSISSGTATFENGQTTITGTISNNAATAIIKSSTVSSVSITATYQAGSIGTTSVTFTQPTQAVVDIALTQSAIDKFAATGNTNVVILGFDVNNGSGVSGLLSNSNLSGLETPNVTPIDTTKTNVSLISQNGVALTAKTIFRLTYGITSGLPGFTVTPKSAGTYNGTQSSSNPVTLLSSDYTVTVTYQ